MPPAWVWIAATLWAAAAQTMRNAAQRHLTGELGTLGATLVRFLYGIPFAALWLWAVRQLSGAALPTPTGKFGLWIALGGLAQIAATALLLRTMQERNFALGVAYSKTEILQVALFGLVFTPLFYVLCRKLALRFAGTRVPRVRIVQPGAPPPG